jgi:hypothetical protein
MKAHHSSSDFDDFLKQHRPLAECEAGALKRLVTRQFEQERKRRRISRAKLPKRMKTCRAKPDRLVAQDQSSVALQLFKPAVLARGRKLKIELT